MLIMIWQRWMLLMQNPKRTNWGKAITKHCQRGRPIPPQTVNIPGSVGAAVPSVPEQAGAATWMAQVGTGSEPCSLPIACKGRTGLPVLVAATDVATDVQMLCAANTGVLRDPRPAVISCWLFGKKVPSLLTACSVLDHRNKVYGVQSSFELIII